ncbi:hypothetical protein GCM10009020_28860 [Natronoarchaeum mannanilyticum]|uniref:Uncharacterized protein n=1 Tax=Natronoarchaeum mannanilyticum TaxID=926360 RepID=A0AAV3TCK9_9EURY
MMSDVALTDYPNNDIETHRRVSKATVVLTGVLALGLVGIGDTTAGTAVIAAGLAAGNGLRLQATQWELEMLQTEVSSDD